MQESDLGHGVLEQDGLLYDSCEALFS